jgi:hypothetical protein
MDARMQRRRALELDLRRALALNQFEVHYQPLLNLENNEISGFEALVRWRHPERGKMSRTVGRNRSPETRSSVRHPKKSRKRAVRCSQSIPRARNSEGPGRLSYGCEKSTAMRGNRKSRKSHALRPHLAKTGGYRPSVSVHSLHVA